MEEKYLLVVGGRNGLFDNLLAQYAGGGTGDKNQTQGGSSWRGAGFGQPQVEERSLDRRRGCG